MKEFRDWHISNDAGPRSAVGPSVEGAITIYDTRLPCCRLAPLPIYSAPRELDGDGSQVA